MSQALWLEIRTNKTVYVLGEPIVVYFTNADGNYSDWVSFFNDGAPNSSYLSYKYLGGVVTGSVTYSSGILTPGDYNARLFSNSSLTLEASCDFTVVSAPLAPVISASGEYSGSVS